MKNERRLLKDFIDALWDSYDKLYSLNKGEYKAITYSELEEFATDWLSECHSEECADKQYREDTQFDYFEEEE